MRFAKDAVWIPLKKTLEPDPFYVEVRDREIEAAPESKRHLSEPVRSDHLWRERLPETLEPGSHLIEVEATDAYGRVHKGHRILRVVE